MTNKTNISNRSRPMSVNVSTSIRKVFQGESPSVHYTTAQGNRNSKKEIKYPLSIHSYNKSEAYRKSLIEDIDKIYENEILAAHGSPTWVSEVSNQMTHSGESPLFLQNLLSPHKPGHKLKRPCSAKSVDEGKYYRPNSMHQYLSATELRDHWQGEVNMKYGRPTRTTLLRARQRAGSAPINAYEKRRKQFEKNMELQESCQSLISPKEICGVDVDGESQHSFLTGARYNAAHILDSRSLYLYGVYMPRGNPTRYFVNGKQQNERKYQCPSAPPDSPRSTVISVSSSSPTVKKTRPKTAPGYGRRSSPSPRHAWADHKNTSPRTETGIISADYQFQSLLPSVKGISVSKSKLCQPHEFPTQSPPPTPASKDFRLNEETSHIFLKSSKLQNEQNEDITTDANGDIDKDVICSTKKTSIEVVGESVENLLLSDKNSRSVSEQSKLTSNKDGHYAETVDVCPACERQRFCENPHNYIEINDGDQPLITRDITSAASSRIITIPSEGGTEKLDSEDST